MRSRIEFPTASTRWDRFPGATGLVLLAIGSLLVAANANHAANTSADLQSLVEGATLRAVAGRFNAPDRFEVNTYRFGFADPIPAGTIEVAPIEIDGPNSSGVMRLAFRVEVDGTPRGVARSTVRGVLRGPALVSTRTLKRGEVIGPADVEIADVDLTRVPGEPLRSARQVQGRVPVRSLGPGRVLTDPLLQAEAVVRRGELVDLKVVRPGLTVTARGKVVRDGALGDTVPAENSRTGAVVMGLVQPDGSLLVVRGAVPERQR